MTGTQNSTDTPAHPTAAGTTRRAGMVLLLDGGVGHEWKKVHGDATFLGGARACETDPARTGVPSLHVKLSWPNGQGVALLRRRLRVRVPS